VPLRSSLGVHFLYFVRARRPELLRAPHQRHLHTHCCRNTSPSPPRRVTRARTDGENFDTSPHRPRPLHGTWSPRSSNSTCCILYHPARNEPFPPAVAPFAQPTRPTALHVARARVERETRDSCTTYATEECGVNWESNLGWESTVGPPPIN
jgi:hypothetical protein